MNRWRLKWENTGLLEGMSEEKKTSLGIFMERQLRELLDKHYEDTEGTLFSELTNSSIVPLSGKTSLEAGYVWAPYIPVHRPVNIDYAQDLVAIKVLRTRYAHKIVNPGFYGKITFTDLGVASTNPCAEIPLDDGEEYFKKKLHAALERTAPAVIADPAMYPHKCTRCGAPAYVGFMKVDCSRKSCC